MERLEGKNHSRIGGNKGGKRREGVQASQDTSYHCFR
jgi:hypothetical protein